MQILILPVRLSNKTLKPIFNSLLQLHNGPGVSPTIHNWKKKSRHKEQHEKLQIVSIKV